MIDLEIEMLEFPSQVKIQLFIVFLHLDWEITTSAETQMENQDPGATTLKELHHDLTCVTYQTAARFRE